MNRLENTHLPRSPSKHGAGNWSNEPRLLSGDGVMTNQSRRKSQADRESPLVSESSSESNSLNAQASFGQILDRAKRGDQQAIGRLCEISQKYLLLIANQDLNPQMLQKFGASDVVQQSMIIANNKIDGFRGSTKAEFLAWMKQILLNECRQTTRGFQRTDKRNVNREQTMSPCSNETKQLQLGDPNLTPSSEAVNNEQMQLLVVAMNQLPESERRVIEMRNWQELSFDEIGMEIGKTSGAARKIWSRAILKLEKELSKLNAI